MRAVHGACTSDSSPERDRPARGRTRVVVARPAPAARRGSRAALRVGGRGRRRDQGRWRSAVRRRSASPLRTARAGGDRAARISTRPYETLASSRPTAVNLALGARRDARGSDARACAGAPRGGGRALPADGAPRKRARACRRSRRSRTATPEGSRRAATARRSGRCAPAWEQGRVDARLGRRDAAAAPGRAPHRLGARDARHPVLGDRGRRGRIADGGGRGRLRVHRRRPDRGQRRHGEQDRHVRARDRCARTTTSRSTSSRRPRRSTSSAATGADIPIEERDPAEVSARFPARNPAFDVTPAGADHRDRDRGGRPPRAVRQSLPMPVPSGRSDRRARSPDRAILERFGFDPDLFESLRARVATGDLSPGSNVVQGVIEPPRAEDLTHAPCPGRARVRRGARRGTGRAPAGRGRAGRARRRDGDALRRGRQGRADGGRRAELPRVEALADALARAVTSARDIPVALMTSFATDEVVRAHVAEHELGDPFVFHQFVSLRLETDGELFHDDDGKPSLYAPGHGDLFQALRRSGVRTRSASVASASSPSRTSTTSAHESIPRSSGCTSCREPVTCEVARKEGDMGGAPVRVDGRLQMLEGPRFPRSFDQELVPVFNTNTALFDLDALDRDYDLTWMYVQKDVDGRTAVQVERAVSRGFRLPADHVSRRPSPRTARTLHPDQDARRSRASAGRSPRACSPRRRSDAKSARSRCSSRRTVGMCERSICSSRSDAPFAHLPGARCVRRCRRSLTRLARRYASAVALPAPWPVRRCAECSGRRLAFARARAAIVYDERARVLVREWKERGRRGLARDAAALVAEVVPPPDVEALTHVPGDPERAWVRGDVAPRDLARALEDVWEAPFVDLLRRRHALPRQRGLGSTNGAATFAAASSPQREAPPHRVSRGRRLHVRRDRRRMCRGVAGMQERAVSRSSPWHGQSVRVRVALLRQPIRKGASMRLQVKAHQGHVSDTIRAYAEKRLGKLERRLYAGPSSS